ncbi:MAG: ArsA-related P-loop ATPase [Solirubrobacteraceae bacterium]
MSATHTGGGMAASARSQAESTGTGSSWRLTTERLVIVSGKGGVGKSTVAAAIAVAASRRGFKTLVAELSGRRDAAALLPSRGDGTKATSGESSVAHVTIQRRTALQDYLRREAGGRLAEKILTRSRMFELFVEAAPGLGELLTIGKIWELARPRGGDGGERSHDLVVLDAPASGQLIGLLTAPRTFGSIARVGPVASQAGAVDRMLRDPSAVAVVAVATAEQMAVTETVGLHRRLEDELGVGVAAVVVNKMLPARFTAREVARLALAPDDPAIRTAMWFDARARAQRAQLTRLRRGLPSVPCSTLPFIFADELDAAAVEHLAGAAGRWLP